MRRLRLEPTLALATCCVLLACGSSFSAGPPDAGSSGDGGADGTLAESAAADGGDAEAGAVEAASGNIVFVSPSGSDTATGLSPTAPKRSIAAALTEARTLPGVPEIRVCAGNYAETKLSISDDVVLEGSFDCTAWTRTATYGFPGFDGANATTIQNAEVTTQSTTLVVTGVVTSATVIDGFVIAGASSSSLFTYGVHVAAGASPVFSNDVIGGGSGAGGTTATGSIGVLVDGTSAPEIKACAIGGGTGTGVEGSIGVDLNTTGAVNLHDSVVSGGGGKLATASNNFATIGIRVRASLATATPLLELVVSGSDATAVSGRSAGVQVTGTGVSASIAASDVSGGSSSTASTFGVYASASGGTLAMIDDRIYGGASSGSSAPTYGVYVVSAGSLLVANSMVHGGTVPAVAGSYTVGVDLSAVAAPAILFSTVYTGATAGTAIALNTGVTAALISDDLLVGADSALGSFGVAATGCSGFVGTLDHTAFANLPALYDCPPGDGGTTLAATVADLTLDLGAPATAGDLLLETPCAGATGCALVAGCPAVGEGCPTSIFGTSWTGDGIASLTPSTFVDGGLANPDWALAAGSPCAVARGGVTIKNLGTDIDSRARSATTPSIGAVEYPATATCK